MQLTKHSHSKYNLIQYSSHPIAINGMKPTNRFRIHHPFCIFIFYPSTKSFSRSSSISSLLSKPPSIYSFNKSLAPQYNSTLASSSVISHPFKYAALAHSVTSIPAIICSLLFNSPVRICILSVIVDNKLRINVLLNPAFLPSRPHHHCHKSYR